MQQFKYTKHSKPTWHNEHLYDSVLEANWAKFFDKCRWKYNPHPKMLANWSPDFEIITPNDRRLLVEVKPISMNGVYRKDLLNTPFAKAVKHCKRHNVLLLGLGPYTSTDCAQQAIGVLCQHVEVGTHAIHNYHDYYCTAEVSLKVGKSVGLGTIQGGWKCLLTAAPDKLFDPTSLAYRYWKDIATENLNENTDNL